MKVSESVVANGMLWNVLPPSLLICHCTRGAGRPVADAVNVTCVPAFTVVLVGLLVTTGATSNVTLAALLLTVPSELVKTARGTVRCRAWRKR